MSILPGIDKLHLTTPDFRVKSLESPTFSVDTSTKQGMTPDQVPYLMTEGKPVKAWKAYHNGDITGASYTISDKGLLVSFNPSKMNHPYLLTGIGDPGYKGALQAIESEMRAIGISADLGAMKICRVDLAKQLQMIHPLHQYQSAFRLLKASRAKGREYDGGYLFANKSNQTLFYDKIKELDYQKIGGIAAGEKNLMRGEIRQLKSDAVGSIFNLSLLHQFNELTPTDLGNIYSTYLNKRIFARQYLPDQMQIDFNSEVQILRQYKESNPKTAWQNYIMDAGIEAILMKFGSIDNIGQLLQEVGYNRTAIPKIKNRMRDMLNRKAYFDTCRNEVSTTSLLYELQEKFAA